jgi:hypothetical protein
VPATGENGDIDIDATVIVCGKPAAKRAYDGNRSYRPVLGL